MDENMKEEIRMLNQVSLAIFLSVNFALFCSILRGEFPWLGFVCVLVGLSIILVCSTGKKWVLFNISLMFCTIVLLIVFNWSVLFSIQ